MTTINFEIDDGLSYAENIKAFVTALEQVDADLATALAKQLASVPDDPTHGRDAALASLFSAMQEGS